MANKIVKGLFICLGAVFLMSHNTYAATYFQPEITVAWSVSRTQCNSSSCWTTYGNEYITSAVMNSYDSETGEGIYSFDPGTSWLSWCSGYQCFINIRYLAVNTRVLSNGSYITPDFTDGSMLHINIKSHHQFYLGDGSDINFNYTGQGYNWNLTGGDAMLISWTSNNPYLCWSEGQGICETHYYEDIAQDGGTFTTTLDLDTSKINTDVNMFYFGEWPYNSNQNAYVITTGNTFIHQFEWKGVNSTDLTFRATVSTDSTFSSAAEGNDIENEYYQNNMNAINNINGLTPGDINTGDSTSATNLLTNIRNIFTAIGNAPVGNTCSINANLGNLNLGNINFCTGKEQLPFPVTFGAYAFELIFVVGTSLLLIRQLLSLFDWARV